MRIIFWQNALSIHQSPFINSLAKDESVNSIILVVENEFNHARVDSGWEVPKFDNKVEIIISPSKETIMKMFRAEKNSFHILSGLFNSTFGNLIKQNFKYFPNLYLLSETAGRKNKFTNLLIKYKYKKALRGMHEKISGVFAIGKDCPVWLDEKLGINDNIIYPFGYFINPGNFNVADVIPNKTVSVLFVGRLESVKGIFGFVQQYIKSQYKWELNIVGGGSLEREIVKLISKSDNNCKLLGLKKHSELRGIFNESDILILPNLYEEGWGVVINEALSYGLMPICSELTGSRRLVENCPMGSVVARSGNKEILNIIDNYVNSIGHLERLSLKKTISSWHDEKCSSIVAVKYFLNILNKKPNYNKNTFGWL